MYPRPQRSTFNPYKTITYPTCIYASLCQFACIIDSNMSVPISEPVQDIVMSSYRTAFWTPVLFLKSLHFFWHVVICWNSDSFVEADDLNSFWRCFYPNNNNPRKLYKTNMRKSLLRTWSRTCACEFRQEVGKRFGAKRGNITKAFIEAIELWITQRAKYKTEKDT